MKHGTRMLLGAMLLGGGGAAQASGIDLLAVGSISGAYEDLARDSATALENGIPGNRLGGMGSGLAYAGGSTFLMLPDRGPNAKAYNSGVDDTASYIPRFHTLNLALSPSDAGAALPYTLTPMLQNTTLLYSRTRLVYGSGSAYGLGNGAPVLNDARHYYFSGRSDNYDPAQPSSNADNARLDPEGIRVSAHGNSVFISDEYGPYVYEFDRDSGQRRSAFKLPAKFAVRTLSAKGDTEIAGNSAGRVANKGMEGLAISPNGRYLFGAMQSPLLQDGGTSAAYTRIVRIDTLTGATQEYAYELSNIGSQNKPKYPTVSEVLAVNDHQLLVDERDGKGLGDDSSAAYKRIYLIDLNGAVTVDKLVGADQLAGKAPAKTLFLDVVAALTAHGFDVKDIPAKIEGIAFGPDLQSGNRTLHTLYVANDNDYLASVTDGNHPAGAENPNRIFVFGFEAASLPGYQPQQIDERGVDPFCLLRSLQNH
ncbi:Uncharacterized conserved protein [Solimonas aquatica]|uniref:Uncharacterized conserved protein n=1 Tax=Solimonas aquatica TaxID=489703 RepID=A0A1H8ZIQ5_9GAMM|nr:esterase-like activity of phytase family protein [Solimonas aquatica]SEP64326.1 Uncharacterized conserved protein [Solimonas aquatica]